MIVELGEHTATVTREEGDPYMKNESALLYAIKKQLIAMGHDAIKKLMWKDGHLVADNQHYIRTRKGYRPSFMLWDGLSALRLLTEPWRENGEIKLNLEWHIWNEEEET